MTPLPSQRSADSCQDVEAIYDHFEEEWAQFGAALIADHLPSADSREHALVLPELAKIDLERRWANGRKAMAKEPGRRYATASAFADDLQRYLNHQPIRTSAPEAGPFGRLQS